MQRPAAPMGAAVKSSGAAGLNMVESAAPPGPGAGAAKGGCNEGGGGSSRRRPGQSGSELPAGILTRMKTTFCKGNPCVELLHSGLSSKPGFRGHLSTWFRAEVRGQAVRGRR